MSIAPKLAITVLAACTRLSAPTGPPDHELVDTILSQPLPADPGPDEGGHALQRRMLADGRATWEEYEEAFGLSVECIRAEGFAVQFPGESRAVGESIDSRYILTAEGVNIKDQEHWDRTEMPCRAQWSWYVEQVWIQQMVKSAERR